MEHRKTLMMIGIGDLAGLTLNHLIQRPRFGRIVLAGRNVPEMEKRKNLALLFAAQLGYYHDIECVEVDLADVGRTAQTIANEKPDLIFNTASLQSWRFITYLPSEVFQRLDRAQFGPWLPMHLVPAHRLMLAVRASGRKPFIVNAAFPDAVGPVLRAKGLAPDSGIGNVANVVPAIRGSIGKTTGTPLEHVEISLFAQHFFSHRLPAYGDAGGSPYALSAQIDGQHVEIDEARVFSLVKSDFKRTGGAFRQMITAASALSILLPLIEDVEATAHAPSPAGLPGGYRVRIRPGSIEPDLPEGLSLDQAIRVNEECQKFDGIDSIAEDGVVHFGEEQMAIMRAMLGYDCPSMSIEDAELRAGELRAKFLELASSYGVKI